jgi:NTP pyrophosphatase (non-canonical NTP hydrolase)
VTRERRSGVKAGLTAGDFGDFFAPPASPLAELGASIALNLREHFPANRENERQVLALAEEVGELVGAYRRWAGMARRTGPWSDVVAELADVAISAYVLAATLGIDLDAACQRKAQTIFARGWKDPR